MTCEWGKIIGHIMMYSKNVSNIREKLEKDLGLYNQNLKIRLKIHLRIKKMLTNPNKCFSINTS